MSRNDPWGHVRIVHLHDDRRLTGRTPNAFDCGDRQCRLETPYVRISSHDCIQPYIKLLFLSLALFVVIGCGGSAEVVSRAESSASRTLQFSSDRLNLGVIPKGGKAQIVDWLMNRSDRPLRVGDVKTSCPCLEVDFGEDSVPADGKVPVRFRFDGSKEPDFTGNLGITVNVSGSANDADALVTVLVNVVEPDVLGRLSR